jgi:two-component system sensor histidine kinase RegB
VVLEVTSDGEALRVAVHDRGDGMPPEVFSRAGEPFYSTKEPGRGLGLGLFLARIFAERLGGSLTLETGAGTTAVLELPLAPASGEAS